MYVKHNIIVTNLNCVLLIFKIISNHNPLVKLKGDKLLNWNNTFIG